jgi:hypothetical protein
MPALHSHTHLQAAQIQAQFKACKRVCLPKPTTDRNNTAKIKYRIMKDKDGQLVTGGIFYCRDSAEINRCGSHQTLSWLDSDVLRNRQQKHTANR